MALTFADLKEIANALPSYNGDIKLLPHYVREVDKLDDLASSCELSRAQQSYMLSIIKSKITGQAQYIFSDNNFETWNGLKNHLQSNFEDRLTYFTIIRQLMNTDHINNIEQTLNMFNNKFQTIKSKISLTDNIEITKKVLIDNFQQLIVEHFISLLPISIRGSFINKNPKTLEEIEQLFNNEFNYAQNLCKPLSKPNTFPNKPQSNFPSKPFNPQDSKISGPNNFNKQNVKNFQNTKRYYKPEQMSLQTRRSEPMSTQTIGRNFYNENSEPEIPNNSEIYENDEHNELGNDHFLEISPEYLESDT